MLKSGLTSVTFRSRTADEIIACCEKCGLSAIEWGSDIHCPPGDITTAEAVAEKMRKSRLAVSSYGSYYRLGCKDGIAPYLETAAALGAPHIRIWSGKKAYSETTPAKYAAMVCEAKRCCREAESRKMWGEFIRILNKSKAEPYLLFEFLRKESFDELSRESEIMQDILNEYRDTENG